MTAVIITFDGEPVGKQRPRFGKGRTYTPTKTVVFETALAWQARIAMRGRTMLAGPLAMHVEATVARPTSTKIRAKAIPAQRSTRHLRQILHPSSRALVIAA
jgi:Holliday junction resolvase RusA-like endonuclease